MAEDKGRQLLLADGKHSAEEERQAIQYLLDLRCDAIMIYPRFLSVDEIDDIIDAHSQPIMVLNRRLRKTVATAYGVIKSRPALTPLLSSLPPGIKRLVLLPARWILQPAWSDFQVIKTRWHIMVSR